MEITAGVIAQIDRALDLYHRHLTLSGRGNLVNLTKDVRTEVVTLIAATIDRLAPPGSQYRNALMPGSTLVAQIGALRVLRRDYEDGCITTVQGLIRAEVFGDFLEMAQHLVDEGYKDPAAVLAGGVLEEHLRKLCGKFQLPTTRPDGKPKKADAMNADLAKASAYSIADQKHVTGWLDHRNNAAHGKYGAYTDGQIKILIQSIRDFITRVPA